MKKLLSLILSAMLLLGLALPAAQAEDPYNIVFTFAASGDLNRVNEISQLVSAYTLDKIGCTVTLQPVSFANWNQKMNLVLASSGEQVDVISCLTGSFAGYTAKNQLVDMTQLVADIYPEYADEFGASLLSCGTVSGKVLGLPTIKDAAAGLGLYFSKTLVDELSLDLTTVKTLEDLTPLFAQVKEAHPELYPFAIDGSGYGMMSVPNHDSLGDNYGAIFNCLESTEVINPYASEEYYNYLKLANEWYEAEYISPDALSNTTFIEQDVKDGNALCCFSTNLSIRAEAEDEIYFLQLNQPIVTSNDEAFMMVCIPHNTKNAEKAMEFIKLLYTDETVLNLICWGEEGKDYYLDENGAVNFFEDADFNQIYMYGAGFMIGNDYLTAHYVSYPADYVEQLKAYNEAAPVSKAAGFMFDSSKVTSQISALNNVQAEFLGVLETGMVAPDDLLPDFLNKLKAAGIDTVIAEKQAQLDAWLAAQQ